MMRSDEVKASFWGSLENILEFLVRDSRSQFVSALWKWLIVDIVISIVSP